jgi:hypothetical protein
MAFNRKNLSGNLGVGSDAPHVYSFRDDASTLAQIATADYFLTVYQILEAGDVIIATGSNKSGILQVTASSSTTVTVSDLIGLAVPAAGLASFTGAITNLTVVNGIVTAAS